MKEQQNFKWILKIPHATELFQTAINYCCYFNLSWTPTSDAALRIILSGVNGALASKEAVMVHLNVLESIINEETISVDKLVIIASEMLQDPYFQHTTNDPTMPFTKKHYNLIKRAEMFIHVRAATDIANDFRRWFLATEINEDVTPAYSTSIMTIFYAANGGISDRTSMQTIIANIIRTQLFSSNQSIIDLALTIIRNKHFINPKEEFFPSYIDGKEFLRLSAMQ